MGEPLLVGTPSDGTVNTTQLATDNVSSAKIASSAVTDAKIIIEITIKTNWNSLQMQDFHAASVVQVVRSENLTSTFNTTNSTPQVTFHSFDYSNGLNIQN